MTVRELISALGAAEVHPDMKVKLSGDSMVMGDGYEARQTHEAPSVNNVTTEAGFAILWPTCSWGEAIEYADAQDGDA